MVKIISKKIKIFPIFQNLEVNSVSTMGGGYKPPNYN